MNFSNINNLSIIIFLILLFIGVIFLYGIYKRKKNIIGTSFLLFSFLFLIINIFEIKGGYNSEIVNNDGGKIVFALDVSKSMLVKDINNYNKISRFDASKKLINEYIDKNINNLYGLMVFAGESLEVLPFTNDISVFKTILFGVNNGNVSKYGTNLNSVFDSLGSYFNSEDEGGLAVIFTDGGDDDIDISKKYINELKDKGIKILLVGVGTKGGGKIPEGSDFFGRVVYKTYMGKEIITTLNNKVLKSISSKYNIDYIVLDNNSDFNKISKYITKNIDYINLQKDINYRTDLTRYFIFISMLFFILFLFTELFLGRKI